MPKSDEVIAPAQARGLQLITVGAQGETLQLVEREPTQLGQRLTIEADGKTHKVNAAADRRLSGGQRADRGRAGRSRPAAMSAATLANLARVQPVRGRLERAVITRAGAPVYVDYAHTPDAIEAAIEALRPHAEGRLIIVFGAGGDRDSGKRAEMGAVAARLADVVDRHRRQSAQRGSGRDPPRRSSRARPTRARCGGRREAIARRRSPRPGRTTSSCSPARATSRARSSATACSRSTTSTVARECAA